MLVSSKIQSKVLKRIVLAQQLSHLRDLVSRLVKLVSIVFRKPLIIWRDIRFGKGILVVHFLSLIERGVIFGSFALFAFFNSF